MAKYWTPGNVKTRLGATLGDEVSAALHRLFVIHLCVELAASADHREVVVSPPNKINAFASCLPEDWHFRPQSDGDLGDRMKSWFSQALTDAGDEGASGRGQSPEQTQFLGRDRVLGRDQVLGHDRAVLIGADCPNLTAAEIQGAFESLDRHDIVLGPANDGGYYLIGMRGPFRKMHHDLFDDIPWSSEAVFDMTKRRVEQHGLSLASMPVKIDVDELTDLRALRQILETSGATDPSHARLATEIDRLLPQDAPRTNG